MCSLTRELFTGRWRFVRVNVHTPVSSSRRHSAAPDGHPPADSSSVLLASVQIAHLHELLLADIIHHILHAHTHTHTREKMKKKKRVTDLINRNKQRL